MEYGVGDRVLYQVLVNNPGHMAPGEKIPGTVISASQTLPPVYRIELDMVWGDRVQPHTQGKKIIVGNVRNGPRLTPLAD